MLFRFKKPKWRPCSCCFSVSLCARPMDLILRLEATPSEETTMRSNTTTLVLLGFRAANVTRALMLRFVAVNQNRPLLVGRKLTAKTSTWRVWQQQPHSSIHLELSRLLASMIRSCQGALLDSSYFGARYRCCWYQFSSSMLPPIMNK